MKLLALIIISQFFMACMLLPRPVESMRKSHPVVSSDEDSLEKLLLNDQKSIYEAKRDSNSRDNIRIGMAKKKVKMSMGYPNQVEVAGNPKYENERWIYEMAIPTPQGYYTEKKVIYFENGAVVGWESH